MCGAGFHLHTLHMVLRDLPQLTMTAFSAQGMLGGDQTAAPFINVGAALQTLHLHRTIDRPGCMGRHLDVHTDPGGGAQWRHIDDFAQQTLVWVSVENQQAG